MHPQEIFLKFDALRWLLRLSWGLKTSLGNFRFSLGMVTEFVSRPYAWRLVSIGIGSFRYTRGIGRRNGARKPVNRGYAMGVASRLATIFIMLPW